MEKLDPVIEESWKEVLKDEFSQSYFHDLKSFLVQEKAKYRIFPPGNLIFNAFNLTPFGKVKVVILGQDPYHGINQAHGLCFSVQESVPKPPSLINIFKELETDCGIPSPSHGNLAKWALQGVLLINATLTVRENQAGSHQNHGWEKFTDKAISELSLQRKGIVFVLWGNFAIAKRSLIDESKHLILTAAHPSPLSAHRGFFGCRHFSQINTFLNKNGIQEIDWRIE
ncbi:MAG: uracil-DNA glycosylase [Bacteroidetes bacterium]|nr:uracil-DNA glycosylase [Bacteroidota bacterium]